jgi:MFS family permease
MNPLLSALQLSNRQLWFQALGRSLYQIGSGLLYFYIPLVFVNQVGLTATSVGLSLGLSSLAGVLGHIVGGILADSAKFGRRGTLLFSASLGVLISLLLAFTQQLPLLITACLLMGVSVGMYWTAADAAVMDVTEMEERPQAFAVMSVAENLGNGIGILGGGVLLMLAQQSSHLLLFLGCGGVFLGFLVLVQVTMPETRQVTPEPEDTTQGILIALRDRALLVFVLANVLFTTYIALVTSTIPLYFTNFVPAIAGPSSSVASTAPLFTWCYIGVGALLQIPIAQALARFRRSHVLMFALFLWAIGFGLVWATGVASDFQWFWGMSALCMFAIASVTYKPFAAAIVSELAPPSLRGAYVAISSQCWAIGYFVGPILGGWAMDQIPQIAHRSWLVAATSTIAGIIVLQLFAAIHPEPGDPRKIESNQ